MKKSLVKFISILLSFAFFLQQTGFALAAGELDLSSRFTQLRQTVVVNNFRPIHLRYLQYIPQDNNFKLLLDKGGLTNPPTKELESSTKELLKYFFIGLSLPNDSFWVNLRPDSPNNVIDPYLATTDIGKVLLEADLNLKKDTSSYTSPDTKEGREYWTKLYQKAGELLGSQNITIPTLVRPWIVPGEIIIRESKDNAYIYKATLKVMLEEDYLKSTENRVQITENIAKQYNFSDDRLKALNKYSSELIKELIIPKLTKEINTSKRYAPLRQVYYSLILSQWFKSKYKGQSNNTTSALIDSQNLNQLTSKTPYSTDTYFNQYKDSFSKGEYNIKEPTYTLGGQTIRTYFSGGLSFDTKTMTGAMNAGLVLNQNTSISNNFIDVSRNIIGAEFKGDFTNMDKALVRAWTPVNEQAAPQKTVSPVSSDRASSAVEAKADVIPLGPNGDDTAFKWDPSNQELRIVLGNPETSKEALEVDRDEAGEYRVTYVVGKSGTTEETSLGSVVLGKSGAITIENNDLPIGTNNKITIEKQRDTEIWKVTNLNKVDSVQVVVTSRASSALRVQAVVRNENTIRVTGADKKSHDLRLGFNKVLDQDGIEKLRNKFSDLVTIESRKNVIDQIMDLFTEEVNESGSLKLLTAPLSKEMFAGTASKKYRSLVVPGDSWDDPVTIFHAVCLYLIDAGRLQISLNDSNRGLTVQSISKAGFFGLSKQYHTIIKYNLGKVSQDQVFQDPSVNSLLLVLEGLFFTKYYQNAKDKARLEQEVRSGRAINVTKKDGPLSVGDWVRFGSVEMILNKDGEDNFVLVEADDASRRHTLVMGSNTVGRSDSNKVRLNSSGVSRNHAEILVSEDGVEVYDLMSTNKTGVTYRKQQYDVEYNRLISFLRRYGLEAASFLAVDLTKADLHLHLGGWDQASRKPGSRLGPFNKMLQELSRQSYTWRCLIGIDLSMTSVTSLEPLLAITSLDTLQLYKTRITDRQIGEFLRAHPNGRNLKIMTSSMEYVGYDDIDRLMEEEGNIEEPAVDNSKWTERDLRALLRLPPSGPLSEAVINKAYVKVAPRLHRDARREEAADLGVGRGEGRTGSVMERFDREFGAAGNAKERLLEFVKIGQPTTFDFKIPYEKRELISLLNDQVASSPLGAQGRASSALETTPVTGALQATSAMPVQSQSYASMAARTGLAIFAGSVGGSVMAMDYLSGKNGLLRLGTTSLLTGLARTGNRGVIDYLASQYAQGDRASVFDLLHQAREGSESALDAALAIAFKVGEYDLFMRVANVNKVDEKLSKLPCPTFVEKAKKGDQPAVYILYYLARFYKNPHAQKAIREDLDPSVFMGQVIQGESDGIYSLRELSEALDPGNKFQKAIESATSTDTVQLLEKASAVSTDQASREKANQALENLADLALMGSLAARSHLERLVAGGNNSAQIINKLNIRKDGNSYSELFQGLLKKVNETGVRGLVDRVVDNDDRQALLALANLADCGNVFAIAALKKLPGGYLNNLTKKAEEAEEGIFLPAINALALIADHADTRAHQKLKNLNCENILSQLESGIYKQASAARDALVTLVEHENRSAFEGLLDWAVSGNVAALNGLADIAGKMTQKLDVQNLADLLFKDGNARAYYALQAIAKPKDPQYQNVQAARLLRESGTIDIFRKAIQINHLKAGLNDEDRAGQARFDLNALGTVLIQLSAMGNKTVVENAQEFLAKKEKLFSDNTLEIMIEEYNKFPVAAKAAASPLGAQGRASSAVTANSSNQVVGELMYRASEYDRKNRKFNILGAKLTKFYVALSNSNIPPDLRRSVLESLKPKDMESISASLEIAARIKQQLMIAVEPQYQIWFLAVIVKSQNPQATAEAVKALIKETSFISSFEEMMPEAKIKRLQSFLSAPNPQEAIEQYIGKFLPAAANTQIPQNVRSWLNHTIGLNKSNVRKDVFRVFTDILNNGLEVSGDRGPEFDQGDVLVANDGSTIALALDASLQQGLIRDDEATGKNIGWFQGVGGIYGNKVPVTPENLRAVIVTDETNIPTVRKLLDENKFKDTIIMTREKYLAIRETPAAIKEFIDRYAEQIINEVFSGNSSGTNSVKLTEAEIDKLSYFLIGVSEGRLLGDQLEGAVLDLFFRSSGGEIQYSGDDRGRYRPMDLTPLGKKFVNDQRFELLLQARGVKLTELLAGVPAEIAQKRKEQAYSAELRDNAVLGTIIAARGFRGYQEIFPVSPAQVSSPLAAASPLTANEAVRILGVEFAELRLPIPTALLRGISRTPNQNTALIQNLLKITRPMDNKDLKSKLLSYVARAQDDMVQLAMQAVVDVDADPRFANDKERHMVDAAWQYSYRVAEAEDMSGIVTDDPLAEDKFVSSLKDELMDLGFNQAEVESAKLLVAQIKDAYLKMGLLKANYHNHVHNLIVSFGNLLILRSSGVTDRRMQQAAFLAGLFHDFQVRSSTAKGKGTPALVEETNRQFRDLMLGDLDENYKYQEPAIGAIDNARYKDSDKSKSFISDKEKDDLRKGIRKFLGTSDRAELEAIYNEASAMIRRTDFASGFAPVTQAYKDNANETRKAMDARISKAAEQPLGISDKDLKSIRDFVNTQYTELLKTEGIDQNTTNWATYQRDIELNYLDALKKVSVFRRGQIHQLAGYLEKGADQSVAYWISSPKLVEKITEGLGQEIMAGSVGSFPFFFEPELLNKPEVLAILKRLPFVYRNNFMRNMEYFARLSTAKGPANNPMFSEALSRWNNNKNKYASQLDLTISAGGQIREMSSAEKEIRRQQVAVAIRTMYHGAHTSFDLDGVMATRLGQFLPLVSTEDPKTAEKVKAITINVSVARGELLSLNRDVEANRGTPEDWISKMENIRRILQGAQNDFEAVVETKKLAAYKLFSGSDISDSLQNDFRRATYIIDDRITFARGERGTEKRLRLEDLVRDLRTEKTDAILAKEALLEQLKAIDAELAESGLEFKGDELRIKETLKNLIDNAKSAALPNSEYADAIGAKVEASLKDINGKKVIVVTVSDNGTGIPARGLETDPLTGQEKIYNLGFSLRPEGEESTGIGLANVKRTLEIIGGDIKYVTNNEGTTFTVTLPVQSAASSPMQEPAPATGLEHAAEREEAAVVFETPLPTPEVVVPKTEDGYAALLKRKKATSLGLSLMYRDPEISREDKNNIMVRLTALQRQDEAEMLDTVEILTNLSNKLKGRSDRGQILVRLLNTQDPLKAIQDYVKVVEELQQVVLAIGTMSHGEHGLFDLAAKLRIAIGFLDALIDKLEKSGEDKDLSVANKVWNIKIKLDKLYARLQGLETDAANEANEAMDRAQKPSYWIERMVKIEEDLNNSQGDFIDLVKGLLGRFPIKLAGEGGTRDITELILSHGYEEARNILANRIAFAKGQKGETKRLKLAALIRNLPDEQYEAINNQEALFARLESLGIEFEEGDELSLMEALKNLIENGKSYDPAGVAIEVDIDKSTGQKIAVIKIIDHGPGIPQDKRAEIGNLGVSTVRPGPGGKKGTGKGVANAKRTVEIAGGKLSFETNEAKSPDYNSGLPTGTTFTIRLPMQAPVQVEETEFTQPANYNTELTTITPAEEEEITTSASRGEPTLSVTWPGRLVPVQRELIRRLKEKRAAANLGPKVPLVVIDFGIGEKGAPTTFDLIRMLQEEGFQNVEVYGVDKNLDNLRAAREALNRKGEIPDIKVDFREGNFDLDLSKLSLPPADIVLTANALYYSEPGKEIGNRAKMTQFLKVDGILADVRGPMQPGQKIQFDIFTRDNKIEGNYEIPGTEPETKVESAVVSAATSSPLISTIKNIVGYGSKTDNNPAVLRQALNNFEAKIGPAQDHGNGGWDKINIRTKIIPVVLQSRQPVETFDALGSLMTRLRSPDELGRGGGVMPAESSIIYKLATQGSTKEVIGKFGELNDALLRAGDLNADERSAILDKLAARNDAAEIMDILPVKAAQEFLDNLSEAVAASPVASSPMDATEANLSKENILSLMVNNGGSDLFDAARGTGKPFLWYAIEDYIRLLEPGQLNQIEKMTGVNERFRYVEKEAFKWRLLQIVEKQLNDINFQEQSAVFRAQHPEGYATIISELIDSASFEALPERGGIVISSPFEMLVGLAYTSFSYNLYILDRIDYFKEQLGVLAKEANEQKLKDKERVEKASVVNQYFSESGSLREVTDGELAKIVSTQKEPLQFIAYIDNKAPGGAMRIVRVFSPDYSLDYSGKKLLRAHRHIATRVGSPYHCRGTIDQRGYVGAPDQMWRAQGENEEQIPSGSLEAALMVRVRQELQAMGKLIEQMSSGTSRNRQLILQDRESFVIYTEPLTGKTKVYSADDLKGSSHVDIIKRLNDLLGQDLEKISSGEAPQHILKGNEAIYTTSPDGQVSFKQGIRGRAQKILKASGGFIVSEDSGDILNLVIGKDERGSRVIQTVQFNNEEAYRVYCLAYPDLYGRLKELSEAKKMPVVANYGKAVIVDGQKQVQVVPLKPITFAPRAVMSLEKIRGKPWVDMGVKAAGIADDDVPAPEGFVISSRKSQEVLGEGRIPDALAGEMFSAMRDLESQTGREFGSRNKPLLVSVRSGASVSLAGAMDSVLNVGLNDDTVLGLAETFNDERFAYDTYRRFIQMYATIVLGLESSEFSEAIKRLSNGKSENELSALELKALVKVFKNIVQSRGKEIPYDVNQQLIDTAYAVFKSWNNDRAVQARKYMREHGGIFVPENIGTAVIIQRMVFGNFNDNSGSGVISSRNVHTGENTLTGDFIWMAQGPDVVGGTKTAQQAGFEELRRKSPGIYIELLKIKERLEKKYQDIMELEITVEDGRLYVLQVRRGIKDAEAAAQIALDMQQAGIIGEEDARDIVETVISQLPKEVDKDYIVRVQPKVVSGIASSRGAVVGDAVFTVEAARRLVQQGKKVVLVVQTLNDESVRLVEEGGISGVVALEGGILSHSARLMRAQRIPVVIGVKDIVLEGRTAQFAGEQINEGVTELTIDGSGARVYLGAIPLIEPIKIKAKLEALLGEMQKGPAVSLPIADRQDVNRTSSPMGSVNETTDLSYVIDEDKADEFILIKKEIPVAEAVAQLVETKKARVGVQLSSQQMQELAVQLRDDNSNLIKNGAVKPGKLLATNTSILLEIMDTLARSEILASQEVEFNGEKIEIGFLASSQAGVFAVGDNKGVALVTPHRKAVFMSVDSLYGVANTFKNGGYNPVGRDEFTDQAYSSVSLRGVFLDVMKGTTYYELVHAVTIDAIRKGKFNQKFLENGVTKVVLTQAKGDNTFNEAIFRIKEEVAAYLGQLSFCAHPKVVINNFNVVQEGATFTYAGRAVTWLVLKNLGFYEELITQIKRTDSYGTLSDLIDMARDRNMLDSLLMRTVETRHSDYAQFKKEFLLKKSEEDIRQAAKKAYEEMFGADYLPPANFINIPQEALDAYVRPEASSSLMSEQQVVTSGNKLGGIDLRGLPITVQPTLGQSSPLTVTGNRIPTADLGNLSADPKWEKIQNMLEGGIVPSVERLKECVASSCAEGTFDQNIDKVLAGIADILRIEEDRVDPTEDALKKLLVLLESNKPAKEISLALANIKPLAKEPVAVR